MQVNSKLTTIHKLGDESVDYLSPSPDPLFSDTFLSKVIHGVSHDLRSPLFVIRSYSQLLQRTQEKERLERGFKSISDATYKMERTVADLVRLMDIYTLPMPAIESLSFKDVFDQANHQLHNELATFQPKIITDFETCPQVQFPSSYLKEIIVSLLDNAMRHNPENKDITIRLRTYTIENRLVLEVKDNGKGVELSTEELDKIKQPFYSISTDEKCSGIGLSKIQAIAQVCKGELELESEHEKGMTCRFYFNQNKILGNVVVAPEG